MEADKSLKSCTMIITEANKFVAEVHDRMPVLLAEQDYEPWLSGKAGLELLKPAAENMLQKWPVSKRVNSSRATHGVSGHPARNPKTTLLTHNRYFVRRHTVFQ
jgi:putative SOS response-associated peptidase YedK